MNTEANDIHILGGGPAGLSLAWFASQTGQPFHLWEAAPRLGGNAITLQSGPFRYDSGAHRFHDKDPEITEIIRELMEDDLLRVTAPSQIWRTGKLLDFPLTPLNLLRNLGLRGATSAGIDLIGARLFKSGGKDSFQDHAIKNYGKTIAEPFLLQYSEKLWGLPADQLAPAVAGKRLKGLDLRTFIVEALFGKIAKTKHIDGAFLYPRQGIGQLWDKMSTHFPGGSIHLNSPVTQLQHNGKQILQMEAGGKILSPKSRIFSTLPLPLMLRMLNPAPPRELLNLAKGIRFRHLILVAAFTNRPQVTPNASLYFPEPEFSFTRVVESKNRSAALVPEGKTVLVAEIPVQEEDELWAYEDGKLIQKVQQELEKTGLVSAKDWNGGAVHRIKNAYPVLALGHEKIVSELREYFSRFSNLQLVGRNAKFEYLHIHDLLRDAKRGISSLTRH